MKVWMRIKMKTYTILTNTHLIMLSRFCHKVSLLVIVYSLLKLQISNIYVAQNRWIKFLESYSQLQYLDGPELNCTISELMSLLGLFCP